MENLPIELALDQILLTQAFVFGYFVLVLVHFTLFSLFKPRVERSRRSLNTVKTVYMIVWLAAMCFILFLIARSVMLAWDSDSFSTRWLDVVDEVHVSYECT